MRSSFRAGWLALIVTLLPAFAHAQGIPPLSSDPDASVSTLRSYTVLGDSVTPFTVPNAFAVEDYAIDWIGAPIPGAAVTLEHGSLEWVRLDKGRGYLDVPRARISVAIPNAEGGRVTNSGFTQPLLLREGFGTAEMTIPMLSGKRNPITIAVIRGGKEIVGHLQLRFAPGPELQQKGRIYRDVTCSPYRLTIESTGMREDEWAFIGCNLVTVGAAGHLTTFLELLVLWDGTGDTIEVGGAKVAPVSDSLWAIQASPRPGSVELVSGAHHVTLRYRIPPIPHSLSVGGGIGPYFDSYTVPKPYKSFQRVEPLVTLYLSYSLGAGSRIAVFDATPVRTSAYTDVGFYLQQKSTELLDRRALFTLFLGGHVLVFKLGDKYYVRPSAPQGGEILLRDIFAYGNNLTVGGLLNPGVSGKYYFNVYLRVGSPRLFFEVNYIGWREHQELTNAPIDLRSLGVSIGGPLFKAF